MFHGSEKIFPRPPKQQAAGAALFWAAPAVVRFYSSAAAQSLSFSMTFYALRASSPCLQS